MREKVEAAGFPAAIRLYSDKLDLLQGLQYFWADLFHGHTAVRTAVVNVSVHVLGVLPPADDIGSRWSMIGLSRYSTQWMNPTDRTSPLRHYGPLRKRQVGESRASVASFLRAIHHYLHFVSGNGRYLNSSQGRDFIRR